VTNAVLSAGDRLQLRFARRGDRWGPTIQFHIAGRAVWQLNSVEGTADEVWPISPAFQSLEMHAQPDGRTFALLVGMAGSSHWSASVEADPIGERIVFDVACRIKIEPKLLGSSYVLSDPASRPRIEAIALESMAGGSQPIIETTGERIVVRVMDLAGFLPRTVRWKYAISASEAAALAR
jgi:hypothetical protein